ncbi:outer membrane protein OmpA-like peptidoglycan-associated protein [Oxalobacteraceae bacterium GrIS 1.11]
MKQKIMINSAPTFALKRLVYLLGTIGCVCLGAQAQQRPEHRGQMLDRSQSLAAAPSASSEREALAFDALAPSGLSVAQRRTMLETVAPAAPARQSVTLDDLSSGTNFESGKALLLPAALERLDQLAARLRGKQAIRLEIVGHTDSQRIAAYLKPQFPSNGHLSQARALAVAAYLMRALDLPASAIAASGRGESQPVAPNDTAQGMARNRRTDIRAWYEEVALVPGPAQERAVALERDACSVAVAAPDAAFSISVDGVPQETDTGLKEADRQRCVDVALERAAIEVKYDPLNVAPALNVWLAAPHALRAAPLPFATYTNYAWWQKRAEIRIFAQGQSSQETPLAVLPVAVGGAVEWRAPAGAPEQITYLLRVYDSRGKFDETRLQSLRLLDGAAPGLPAAGASVALAGWGESSLSLRNIGASGGSVTVSGANIGVGQNVSALGMAVPVDAKGKFALRQILPTGAHTVEVAVKDANGAGMTYRRNLMIADRDWFYVAVADLTVGHDRTRGPAELVTGDTSHYKNESWADGRGAFYLKGKIKGDYLLTASADTREQPLRDLFHNFQSKDPNYLLRRIDPDKYYPVYGDDSSAVDDAPTQGRMYLRLEKGDSSIMWGNFQTSWSGTELAQYSRGLYGAGLQWNGDDATVYGEKISSVNAFAASPGTLQSREEFRGTGGSLYYLHHLDLSQGSERLWIEVRDKDSGLVIERTQLTPSQDYEINYLQGRLTLRSPLSSVADGSALVQSASLNGNPLYLVATYEYVPGLSAIAGTSTGVRASHWVNDHVRLGLSDYHQGEQGSDQTLKELDLTLRYKPGTWIKAEAARSSGDAGSTLSSSSGGFDFAQSVAGGRPANAKRYDAALDLADLGSAARGRLAAYFQDREAGYSAPGLQSPGGEAVRQSGMAATLPLAERTELAVKADQRTAVSADARALEVALRHKLDAEWGVAAGLRHDYRGNASQAGGISNASPILSQNGGRSDAIVRVDYRPLKPGQDVAAVLAANAAANAAALPGAVPTPDGGTQSGLRGGSSATLVTAGREAGLAGSPQYGPDAGAVAGIAAARVAGLLYEPWDMYGFVQHTLARSGDRAQNERGGLGGSRQLSERLRLGAEASGGSGGAGGQVFGNYQVDERSNLYLNYRLESETPDINYTGRQATLTAGSHYRLNDQAGLFAESRWGNGAGPQSLTHAFGVDLAPNARWTTGLKFETGTLSSPLSGDLKRDAIGLTAAYSFERLKWSSALEYRTDRSSTLGTVAGTCTTLPADGGCPDGAGESKRHVWLTRNALSYQLDRDWRLLGKFNLSRSSSSQGAFYDGDYTEVVSGAAYRPVDNERWNTLFKYTYFYNLPSPGQVDGVTGGALDYTQKSHIVDVDSTYDVKPWLALGAKYGVRVGQLRASKTEGDWFSSRAALVVLRADLHWVKEWDALLEVRRLSAHEAGDARSGALIGVYRHVAAHAKIGIGYNFTTFSDDMTDLSYRSRGWFMNAISTF